MKSGGTYVGSNLFESFLIGSKEVIALPNYYLGWKKVFREKVSPLFRGGKK
jgi:hypothetical protein